MTPLLPFLVGSNQMRDQVALVGIDPLIDSFVAHRKFRMKLAPTTGGEFWRPSGDDPSADITTNARFLEAVSLMTDNVSNHGSLMGFVRKIVPRMDRWCVSLELARKGADVSAELPGDGLKRFPFASKHGNEIALLLGQMLIGFLGHNRAS